jgi:hypothetical protein
VLLVCCPLRLNHIVVPDGETAEEAAKGASSIDQIFTL